MGSGTTSKLLNDKREEARKFLLKTAQEEINELIKQQNGKALRYEELETLLREIIKYLEAVPVHEGGPGG